MTRRAFITGTIILMGAGFIARLFGFAYRIYLSNLIGAEGIGLFQLVLPIYTAVVLTLTSGISVAVSRMTAEQQARNNSVNPGRITALALSLVLFAGIAVSAILFFNLKLISTAILGDSRTYLSLLLIVPCLPAVVAGSALKGYFYGIQRVAPTAVSQILEQAVKIGFVVVMSAWMMDRGVEYACAIASLSAALGEIANLTVLAVVYAFKSRQSTELRQREKRLRSIGKPMRKRAILRELIYTAAPISLNKLIVSALSATEYVMIPAMLVSGGLDSRSSMEVFGRLMGMTMPLIMFPSLVTNSLATTLVPAISESLSMKNFRTLNYRISRSIQISFILGMIFTALFINYPDSIGALVYRKEKIGDLLFLMAFSCAFIYLQQTLTGILNGLGRQGILLRNTIIGSLIRIGAVVFLIPAFGIRSYILGFAASFLLSSSLNLAAVHRITGLLPDFREWMLKPVLAALAMVLTGKFVLSFFEIFRYGQTVTLLLTMAANILISGFLMMLMGVLTWGEILQLFGMKNGSMKSQ